MRQVGALGMVAGIDQNQRLWPQLCYQSIGSTPIGEIGMVESRFKEFVLYQQAQVVAKSSIDLAQGLGQTMAARAHIVLAGIVGTIGQPEADRIGAGHTGDLHALQHMLDSPSADRCIGMAETTKAVFV